LGIDGRKTAGSDASEFNIVSRRSENVLNGGVLYASAGTVLNFFYVSQSDRKRAVHGINNFGNLEVIPESSGIATPSEASSSVFIVPESSSFSIDETA
jgi:hypothetical protein